MESRFRIGSELDSFDLFSAVQVEARLAVTVFICGRSCWRLMLRTRGLYANLRDGLGECFLSMGGVGKAQANRICGACSADPAWAL